MNLSSEQIAEAHELQETLEAAYSDLQEAHLSLPDAAQTGHRSDEYYTEALETARVYNGTLEAVMKWRIAKGSAE